MKKRGKIFTKIFSLILWGILIYLCIRAFNTYKTYYFNGFVKGEFETGLTEFIRDKDVKYGEERSYKMYSKDFNDSLFYKEIDVKPNTVYKISCMVKTENVIPSEQKSDAGAMISIIEDVDVSKTLTGTNDWQELTMMFNSKNREKVKLGFRLGGNTGNAKGTAWFSDFKLEEGTKSNNTNWKMGCFIFRNTSIKIDEEHYTFYLNLKDVENVRENVDRFLNSCKELSNNRMTATCDIHEIVEPLRSISYSEEHGYYIDPHDVKKQIEEIVRENEYDYIFVVARLGNEQKQIPVKEWIGLGGMQVYDIGFSTIRMPNEENSYTFRYDSRVNAFPEEVYLHEFLHTLERISKDYDYNRPELHDYENYGYQEEPVVSLKKWYKDYMTSNILDKQTGKYIGLDKNVYLLKPVNSNSFKTSTEIEFNKEPENIFEEIKDVYKVFTTTLETIDLKEDVKLIPNKLKNLNRKG